VGRAPNADIKASPIVYDISRCSASGEIMEGAIVFGADVRGYEGATGGHGTILEISGNNLPP
jgi:hypothetical protein